VHDALPPESVPEHCCVPRVNEIGAPFGAPVTFADSVAVAPCVPCVVPVYVVVVAVGAVTVNVPDVELAA
jgi:hypothetical protein